MGKTVSGLTAYDSSFPNTLLDFNFDSDGIPNEAARRWAIRRAECSSTQTGKWKLAGINYAVDSPWSYTGGSDTGFDADIFDARGLYYQDVPGHWVLAAGTAPMPGASYASDIASQMSWIQAGASRDLAGRRQSGRHRQRHRSDYRAFQLQ